MCIEDDDIFDGAASRVDMRKKSPSARSMHVRHVEPSRTATHNPSESKKNGRAKGNPVADTHKRRPSTATPRSVPSSSSRHTRSDEIQPDNFSVDNTRSQASQSSHNRSLSSRGALSVEETVIGLTPCASTFELERALRVEMEQPKEERLYVARNATSAAESSRQTSQKLISPDLRSHASAQRVRAVSERENRSRGAEKYPFSDDCHRGGSESKINRRMLRQGIRMDRVLEGMDRDTQPKTVASLRRADSGAKNTVTFDGEAVDGRCAKNESSSREFVATDMDVTHSGSKLVRIEKRDGAKLHSQTSGLEMIKRISTEDTSSSSDVIRSHADASRGEGKHSRKEKRGGTKSYVQASESGSETGMATTGRGSRRPNSTPQMVAVRRTSGPSFARGLFSFGRKLMRWPEGVAPLALYAKDGCADGTGRQGLRSTLLAKIEAMHMREVLVRCGEKFCVRVVGSFVGGEIGLGRVVWSIVRGERGGNGERVIHAEGCAGSGGFVGVEDWRGLVVRGGGGGGASREVWISVGMEVDGRGSGGRDVRRDVRWRVVGDEEEMEVGRFSVALRYGYYFFLAEPCGLRLFTQVDTPEHVRLVAVREGDGSIDEEMSKRLSYIVVRVGRD